MNIFKTDPIAILNGGIDADVNTILQKNLIFKADFESNHNIFKYLNWQGWVY